MNRFIQSALAVALIFSLAGCVAVAVKGVETGSELATIAKNSAAADAGDAEAQYRVGAAYCCAIGKADLGHDNQKATDYLCRAARQNHEPAQYLLGRIYSGHPIVGFNPQESGKLALIGSDKNMPLAIMWLTLAADHSDEEASRSRKELDALAKTASLQDKAKAQELIHDWQNAPCQWNDVFPK
jgi:TPR repeat protein